MYGTPGLAYGNQSYRFAFYAGEPLEATNATGTLYQSPIRILIYRKSDFMAGQTNPIAAFATNTITTGFINSRCINRGFIGIHFVAPLFDVFRAGAKAIVLFRKFLCQ